MKLERVALNPLPWLISSEGEWVLSEPVLEAAFPTAVAAGFPAITIDVPAGMSTSSYSALLTRHRLRPAAGYFQADFHDRDNRQQVLEAARAHIAIHLELGVNTTFIASTLADERIAEPAVGSAGNADLLERLIDGLREVAELMTEHGLTPALHPHVGTWIETEEETEQVLAAIGAEALAFGPDTGHLAWAGMDPAAVIARHSERVRGIHLKDIHRERVAAARRDRLGYVATTTERHTWTEPGRGDVDFDAVFAAAGNFDGWTVIEVDVPDMPSPEESTMASGAWVAARLAGRGV